MEYKNFKIVQQHKIDKYETCDLSGHSWPVMKLLKKFKIETTTRTSGIIRSMREFNSVAKAKEQIDFDIKFAAYHDWCTPDDLNRINVSTL